MNETKKREEMLLVMELSDKAAQIAEGYNDFTTSDLQAAFEAVIMTAIRRTKQIYEVNHV